MTGPMPEADRPAARFYCEPAAWPGEGPGGEIVLDRAESRHAAAVRRLRAGAVVELFDGQGRVAEAELVQAGGGALRCRLLTVRRIEPVACRVTVAAAPPKGARLEQMVEQLSQAGVSRLMLLRTERSVVEPGAHKRQRLERRAIESAKQCGRAWVMGVAGPLAVAELMADPPPGPGLWADTGLAAGDAGEIEPWVERAQQAGGLTLWVGPEGGWTDAEATAARAAGLVPWSLGPHVMRIETAAVVAAGVAAWLLGEGRFLTPGTSP